MKSCSSFLLQKKKDGKNLKVTDLVGKSFMVDNQNKSQVNILIKGLGLNGWFVKTSLKWSHAVWLEFKWNSGEQLID